MAYADTWSIRPATVSDSYFFASAAIGAGGAITLLKSDLAINGAGYQVLFSSSGDSSGRTFTITGTTVGQLTGSTSEVVTAPAAGLTTHSTNYWATVTGISISGASTGNIKIGFTGSLALPRCRIRGVHYVGAASAGSIVVTMNSTTGTEILGIDTPATATFAEYVRTNHILTARSAALSDFAIVTLTQVTKVTLFLT